MKRSALVLAAILSLGFAGSASAARPALHDPTPPTFRQLCARPFPQPWIGYYRRGDCVPYPTGTRVR